MSDELIIYTKRITDNGYPIIASVSPEFIKLEYNNYKFSQPVNVNMCAFLVTKELFVRGAINTFCESECDRCLEKVILPVKINDAFFTYEYTGQDLIDISNELCEEIQLDLPLKVLCSEDCRGLCINCRVNLNKCKCKCDKKPSNNPFVNLKL